MNFLRLIRYKNLLMIALTMFLTKYSLIASYFSSYNVTDLTFSLLVLATLLIAAFGYLYNNIIDYKSDLINKPDKVIAINLISTSNTTNLAFFLLISGNLLGVFLAFFLSRLELYLFFLTASIALIIYTRFAQKYLLIGNILISFLIPLVILTVYSFDKIIVTKHNAIESFFLEIIIFHYLLFSFLSNLIREIIKDIEDVNGDYVVGMKTLPILVGKRRARNVAIFLSSILLILMCFVFADSILSNIRLSLTLLTGIILLMVFIYRLWVAETKKEFSFLSGFMKFIMFLGILSMGLFKFI